MKCKQRGGFFPMMKFLDPSHMASMQEKAQRAVFTGVKMAKDIQDGKNWKVAALDRVSESLKQHAAREKPQLGGGIRRRRTSKKKRTKHGLHTRRLVRVHKK